MPTPLSDDDLASSMIEYPSAAGQILALFCRPKEGGPFPALILLHEWWGLDDHIKEVAHRLCRENYAVLAPDLFSSLGNPVTHDPQTAAALMDALKATVALDELDATVAFLQTFKQVRFERIGVIGFSMGATFALLLACRHRDVKAAVPFYGHVPDDRELPGLSAPVLYVWGNRDEVVTEEEVSRLKVHLERRPGAGEVKIYPAGHSFFNNTRRDAHDPVSARDAWKRVVGFFDHHLKAA